MRKRMGSIRGGRAIAVLLTSAVLAAGGSGVASVAQATQATAFSAIDNSGILSDTATGSDTSTTLSGSSLADGINLVGAGTTTEQSYTDPDDPTSSIVSVGVDTGSAPAAGGPALHISLPASTATLTSHMMSGGPTPINNGTTDSATETAFAAAGIATAPTTLTDTDA